MINVQIVNKQKDLKFKTRAVKALVLAALEYLHVSCDEVHVRFVSESAICKFHKEFFNDSSPTDCITLPIDEEDVPGYRLLGEAIICPKAALGYKDPYRETTRYIIHTLLHLIGFTDADIAGRRQMRQKEEALLRYFDKNNLQLRESLV